MNLVAAGRESAHFFRLSGNHPDLSGTSGCYHKRKGGLGVHGPNARPFLEVGALHERSEPREASWSACAAAPLCLHSPISKLPAAAPNPRLTLSARQER